MKSVGSKESSPIRGETSRKKADLPISSPSIVGTRSEPGNGPHIGKHVYRVGGFRIPVRNSVRGPKSRCAGRVKDLLKKRAEASEAQHRDPTEFEPPIRVRSLSSNRYAPRDSLTSLAGPRPGRERSEPDDNVEDLDDD